MKYIFLILWITSSEHHIQVIGGYKSIDACQSRLKTFVDDVAKSGMPKGLESAQFLCAKDVTGRVENGSKFKRQRNKDS